MKMELVDSINVMLQQQWNPEQISGRLKREGWASICHDTIYQHIA
jgi:IS30 family transposase